MKWGQEQEDQIWAREEGKQDTERHRKTKYGHERRENTRHSQRDKVWHYSPLPNTPSNGEGGWALWSLKGRRTGQDRTGGLQGDARSGTHGGAGSSGGHGGAGSSGGHGGSGDSGGHGGSGNIGRPWRDRLRGRGPSPHPASSAGALLPLQKKNSLGKIGAQSGTWGAREARALGGAQEVRALEGAVEELALEGAVEELALEGAGIGLGRACHTHCRRAWESCGWRRFPRERRACVGRWRRWREPRTVAGEGEPRTAVWISHLHLHLFVLKILCFFLDLQCWLSSAVLTTWSLTHSKQWRWSWTSGETPLLSPHSPSWTALWLQWSHSGSWAPRSPRTWSGTIT